MLDTEAVGDILSRNHLSYFAAVFINNPTGSWGGGGGGGGWGGKFVLVKEIKKKKKKK
jgi:hypothetical protein